MRRRGKRPKGEEKYQRRRTGKKERNRRVIMENRREIRERRGKENDDDDNKAEDGEEETGREKYAESNLMIQQVSYQSQYNFWVDLCVSLWFQHGSGSDGTVV